VASNDSDIDPVGACVGMKGSRVQNVVQELRGEKIDIIPWHVDPAKFVCNALAPAEISRVIIDEANRSMEVIVPDEYLSVAIGKRGQNVRLASKLTRWRLDVKGESQYSATMKDGYESLVALPDVGVGLADALYEKGFFSAEEIVNSSVDDLTQVRGLSEEDALDLIEASRKYLDSLKQETPAEIMPGSMLSEDEDMEETDENSDMQPELENEENTDKDASDSNILSDGTPGEDAETV
jgi:N utilization substance protein A